MEILTTKNALPRASIFTALTIIIIMGLIFLIKTNNQNISDRPWAFLFSEWKSNP